MMDTLSFQRIQLTEDPEDWVWGRWVWCQPTAKPLPFLMVWGSQLWEEWERLPVTGPQMHFLPSRYGRVRTSVYAGTHFKGQQDWWQNGLPKSARASGPVVDGCAGETWGTGLAFAFALQVEEIMGLIVERGGVPVGTEPVLNFLVPDNLTLTVVDDSVFTRVNVLIDLATVDTSILVGTIPYSMLTGTPDIDDLLPIQVGNAGKFLTTDGTNSSWGTVTAGPTPADPSALVGLNPVNGSASTFMRSDAAPALDEAISPSWSGTHFFGPDPRTGNPLAYLTIATPADLLIPAGLEGQGIRILAATRQHAMGNLGTQREFLFNAPTYSFVGPSTITTAVSFETASPKAGANATITNSYAARFIASAAGHVPIVARGATSQTADLQQWQTSASAVIANVTSAGIFNGVGVTAGASGVVTATGFIAAGAAGSTAQAGLFVPLAATDNGTVIQGFAGQSANLSEWRTNSGVVLATVSENGYATTRNNAAPAGAELSTSEGAYWWNNTVGASAFVITGKDSAGTVVTAQLPTLTGNAGDYLSGAGTFVAGSTPAITGVKTANYTAAIGEVVRLNTSAASFTVTLPTAVGNAGKTVICKIVTSSSNAFTVATTAGQTIDGSATLTVPVPLTFPSRTFMSDGANWMVTGASA